MRSCCRTSHRTPAHWGIAKQLPRSGARRHSWGRLETRSVPRFAVSTSASSCLVCGRRVSNLGDGRTDVVKGPPWLQATQTGALRTAILAGWEPQVRSAGSPPKRAAASVVATSPAKSAAFWVSPVEASEGGAKKGASGAEGVSPPNNAEADVIGADESPTGSASPPFCSGGGCSWVLSASAGGGGAPSG